MHYHYHDITDKAGTPDWWDENGTPRYGPFSPTALPDIYADEAVLLEIACQACGRRFHVAMSCSLAERCLACGPDGILLRPMADRIDTLHYGDPPNLPCCPAGPTMTCEDLRVLEFWRLVNMNWERVPELERELNP